MQRTRGWYALAAVVAASLVLLLVVYSTAYFLMVTPGPGTPRTGPIVEGSTDERFAVYPARIHTAASWLFAPIHKVDLRLRPNTWYVVQPGRPPGLPPDLPPPHP